MRSLLHSISYGVPKAPADDNPWGLKEVKDLGLRSGFDPPDLDRPGRLPMGSSQPEMLPSRGLTSDNDQSPDMQCTGAEPSNQRTPHTIDLQTCHICLPRHVHPRPPAAKPARVSFHPDLPVVTQTLITQRGSATGHQSGGWGGHWPKRTEMPQLATGKDKEAMEPPINKRKRTLEALSDIFSLQDVQLPDYKRHAGARHAGSSHQTPGGGSGAACAAATKDRLLLRCEKESMDYDRGVLAAPPSPEPGNSVVAVTTTACYFCRRVDFWPYITCGVCQLTTHVTCYYRLGSNETAYYETHSSDWRCQDCSGPQRHADCVLPHDGLVRHAGPRQSGS